MKIKVFAERYGLQEYKTMKQLAILHSTTGVSPGMYYPGSPPRAEGWRANRVILQVKAAITTDKDNNDGSITRTGRLSISIVNRYEYLNFMNNYTKPGHRPAKIEWNTKLWIGLSLHGCVRPGKWDFMKAIPLFPDPFPPYLKPVNALPSDPQVGDLCLLRDPALVRFLQG